jgi:rubrerythrin
MKEFDSINDILDFAIDQEQEAVDFYRELAAHAKTKDMQAVFEEFAHEEIKHKTRLMDIKEKGLYQMEKAKISDLKIGDYLVNVKPSPGMSYSDALVLAMKKEKAAFKLYMNLSERAHNEEMKNIFLSLAQEESKHKLRFELEYDEFILREN